MRFTPASAGNIAVKRLEYRQEEVHPRIRGEYQIRKKFSFPAYRFTPASAGNIRQPSREKVESEVHPRIRGEYRCVALYPSPSQGSPPHPRGIFVAEVRQTPIRGFTPASAGNMTAVDRKGRSFKVHPRIRGEYCCFCKKLSCPMGSPPHPRGIY